MSKNRYINTKFWDDNYVMELDPSEKLLFIYCLTAPNSHICGCFEVNIKIIALHTGFDKEMIIRIFNRFERDGKIKYYEGWIIIRNFLKHQKITASMQIGIDKEEALIPKECFNWLNYLKVKKEVKEKKTTYDI